jgi:hypothetical protein
MDVFDAHVVHRWVHARGLQPQRPLFRMQRARARNGSVGTDPRDARRTPVGAATSTRAQPAERGVGLIEFAIFGPEFA